MRTTKRFLGWLPVSFLVLWSCDNTPPLPKLITINEASIQGMDSIYLLKPGELLSIYPTISHTMDAEVLDTSRYRYEWRFVVMPGLGSTFDYETIGTDSILVGFDIFGEIRAQIGVYDFTFRVIDTYTDTFTEWPFRVVVGNKYYEGWVVLNEVAGGSRVDMLSYDVSKDSFAYLSDVVDFSTLGTPGGGSPVFIDKIFALSEELGNGGVIVGTDEDVFSFNSVDFGIVEAYYQQYDELRNAPDSAKPFVSFVGNLYENFVQVGADSYQFYKPFFSDPSTVIPVNVRLLPDGSRQVFEASNHVAMDVINTFGVMVLFDEGADEFMWYSTNQEHSSPLVGANVFSPGADRTLVFLAYTQFGGGQYVGLLKEAVTGLLYLIRFTLYDQLEFSKVDIENELYKATYMALDPYTGVLYFSVGQSAFEFQQGGSPKVYDFEGEITMMKFNRFLTARDFMTGSSVNKERYLTYDDKLLVATHQGGKAAGAGELILFDLQKGRIAQRFDGFSKIVDVTYKER